MLGTRVRSASYIQTPRAPHITLLPLPLPLPFLLTSCTLCSRGADFISSAMSMTTGETYRSWPRGHFPIFDGGGWGERSNSYVGRLNLLYIYPLISACACQPLTSPERKDNNKACNQPPFRAQCAATRRQGLPCSTGLFR